MSWRELPLPPGVETLRDRIVDTAVSLHATVGPGLREGVYKRSMSHSLLKQGYRVREEVWLPAEFDGLRIEQAGRADLIVDDTIAVELKANEHMSSFGRTQLIGYLKSTGMPAGVMINSHDAAPSTRHRPDRPSEVSGKDPSMRVPGSG